MRAKKARISPRKSLGETWCRTADEWEGGCRVASLTALKGMIKGNDSCITTVIHDVTGMLSTVDGLITLGHDEMSAINDTAFHPQILLLYITTAYPTIY